MLIRAAVFEHSTRCNQPTWTDVWRRGWRDRRPFETRDICLTTSFQASSRARGGECSIASFLHGDTVILRRVQADDVSRHPGSAPSESRLGCRKTLPKDCLESHGIEIIAMRI